MRFQLLAPIFLATMTLLAGCGDDDGAAVDAGLSPDAGALDGAMVTRDASSFDSSTSDGALALDSALGDAAGSDAAGGDAAGGDSAVDVFGTITEACPGIMEELMSASPSLVGTTFDFGTDRYDDPEDEPRLTPGAQRITMSDNAGGSSILSEAFAFEVLARCEGASLIATETEISYTPVSSAKTDFLV